MTFDSNTYSARGRNYLRNPRVLLKTEFSLFGKLGRSADADTEVKNKQLFLFGTPFAKAEFKS